MNAFFWGWLAGLIGTEVAWVITHALGLWRWT